jgi:hypothetical protein
MYMYMHLTQRQPAPGLATAGLSAPSVNTLHETATGHCVKCLLNRV